MLDIEFVNVVRSAQKAASGREPASRDTNQRTGSSLPGEKNEEPLVERSSRIKVPKLEQPEKNVLFTIVVAQQTSSFLQFSS